MLYEFEDEIEDEHRKVLATRILMPGYLRIRKPSSSSTLVSETGSRVSSLLRNLVVYPAELVVKDVSPELDYSHAILLAMNISKARLWSLRKNEGSERCCARLFFPEH